MVKVSYVATPLVVIDKNITTNFVDQPSLANVLHSVLVIIISLKTVQ